MALPGSGSAISLSQVNSELGRSATQTIDMNDSGVRTLFGRGGSGTQISMSDGWGRSNATVSLSGINGLYFESYSYWNGSNIYGQLDFSSNGYWYWYGNSNNTSGTWISPTGSGVGNNYWIRFTRTSFSGGPYATATASTGWMQLNTTRSIVVGTPLQGANESATYTIEISSSSGGSPVLATASGVIIAVVVESN
jgi:hypothetical protein